MIDCANVHVVTCAEFYLVANMLHLIGFVNYRWLCSIISTSDVYLAVYSTSRLPSVS